MTVLTSINAENYKGGNNAPNINKLCAKLVVFFGLVRVISFFM